MAACGSHPWLPVANHTSFIHSSICRSAKEAAAQADLLGWRAVALFQGVLLIGKTLLQERRPMLALVNGTHTLLALLLAALVQRRRRWYLAHRETLVLFATLHVAAVTLNGGERWVPPCCMDRPRQVPWPSDLTVPLLAGWLRATGAKPSPPLRACPPRCMLQ